MAGPKGPGWTEGEVIDRVHDYVEANRPAGQRAVKAFLDEDIEQ